MSDTVNKCVHVSCYVIHVLWCKRLGKVFIFTGSNAVFFIPNTNFYLFNLVLVLENVEWKSRNVAFISLIGCKQQQIIKACRFEFLSHFLPFLPPSPISLSPRVLLGSCPHPTISSMCFIQVNWFWRYLFRFFCPFIYTSFCANNYV